MNNLNNQISNRENFLLSLLNKVIKEYKHLLEITRKTKPYKIVNIIDISPVPGETKFAVQISHKNIVVELTAAELISENTSYNINDFSNYHADMIRSAAQGKLNEFFKLWQAPSILDTEERYNNVIGGVTNEQRQTIPKRV